MCRDSRVDPRCTGQHVLRLRGSAFHERVTGGRRQLGESVEVRPRPLGIDVVGSQRRDTAPIVDACAEQRGGLLRCDEVRRGLNSHRRTDHHARHRDGRQEFFETGVGHRPHRGIGLGQEVLHDDLLHMTERLVHLTNCHDGLGPVPQRLTDTDEDARREGNVEPARVGQRAQPNLGILVGTAVMRLPLLLEQPTRGGLEHHAHRGGHRLEAREFLPRHHSGIEVRQQAGLLEHPDRHRAHVVQSRVVAA
ncbi:unannotated protein [freshwater metagenome]|uniref:Unannotated protein n=1 Tax=freshwater metagenome TaxID=449393 RepID=A0A6J7J5B5_9ZZZZ